MESLTTLIRPKSTQCLSCCTSPLLLWSSTLQLLELICSSGEEILNITSSLLRLGNDYQQMSASLPFKCVCMCVRVCVEARWTESMKTERLCHHEAD